MRIRPKNEELKVIQKQNEKINKLIDVTTTKGHGIVFILMKIN